MKFKLTQHTISEGINNFLGQEAVTIHPQAARRWGRWRGGKASRGPSVEQPADEEPSGRRLLTWVV
jgi:hypothetical protein